MLLVCLALTLLAQAQTYTERVLYNFETNSEDGVDPVMPLILDASGNLYGVTSSGGSRFNGVVFKVDQQGNEAILYNFGGGVDGGSPEGPLLLAGGKLYGTTASGGSYGHGTLFELSGHTETVLYSFKGGADGSTPSGAIVRDAAGNLYGTTPTGGAGGWGTVFKVAPDGTETVLHSFSMAGGDGFQPQGGLIRDSFGNLYGVTVLGGASGCGSVFRVSTSGQEKVLFSFSSLQSPSLVIRDSAGNFYGTAASSGRDGTVFEILLSGQEVVLHSFGGGGDGEYPYASVIRDSAGNLFGTTYQGGRAGVGTVYKIDSKGRETVLYSFSSGGSDGLNPIAGVVEDATGNLYGATKYGGTHGAGTVFELQIQ